MILVYGGFWQYLFPYRNYYPIQVWGGYLIKKRNPKPIDYNTLFVYNLIVSSILYAIIWITAPAIAEFYNNNGIISAIRVASLAILFQALGITPTNKLLKEMRFKGKRPL